MKEKPLTTETGQVSHCLSCSLDGRQRAAQKNNDVSRQPNAAKSHLWPKRNCKDGAKGMDCEPKTPYEGPERLQTKDLTWLVRYRKVDGQRTWASPRVSAAAAAAESMGREQAGTEKTSFGYRKCCFVQRVGKKELKSHAPSRVNLQLA